MTVVVIKKPLRSPSVLLIYVHDNFQRLILQINNSPENQFIAVITCILSILDAFLDFYSYRTSRLTIKAYKKYDTIVIIMITIMILIHHADPRVNWNCVT